MRELVLDTETTGLDHEDGHRLVEIGIVELENHMPTGNYFHHYLNPERASDYAAEKVHGLSSQFLSDKPKFFEIVDEFLNFISNSKIIIHNASFDLSFLDGELSLIQKEKINKKLVIDSLEIARNKFPGTSNSLDALCRRFNIDLSRRTKHNALLDCELLREVYINLLDVKEPRFNLSNHQNEKKLLKGINYNKKVLEISDSEINLHKEFLKKQLKKNFY